MKSLFSMAWVFFGISVLLTVYIIYNKFSPLIGPGPYILVSGTLSMMLVSIGWWVTLNISIKQNTLNLITRSILSEKYQECLKTIEDKFPDGVVIKGVGVIYI